MSDVFEEIVKAQTESASIQEVENHVNIKFKTRSQLNSRVKVGDIKIDHRYQRALNDAKVDDIVNNFNPSGLGVVILSIRENGEIYAIDGAHRINALCRLGKINHDIDSLVYFDLSLQEEAELYLLLNDKRTKPKRSELAKAAVISGDSKAVAIDNILKKHNLAFGDRPANNTIRAVSTVENIANKAGVDVLDSVLTVLINANGSHASSFQAEYLGSVALIIANYKNIDMSRLTQAIVKLGDPSLYVTTLAINAGSNTHYAKLSSMACKIVDIYNSRLKASRLDKNVVLLLNARNYLNAQS